jgi:hypothetical protein
MTINGLQIRVPKDRLRAASEDERTFFLMLECAADQIIVSVAVPSFAATPGKSLSKASAPQNGSADNRGPLWFWLDGC